MEKLEGALKALFGEEALVLSAETETAWAEKVNALAAELPELRKAAAKAAELALAAETAEKTRLIDNAIAENRAVNAEREGLMQCSVAWLAAELPKRAANAVPTAKLPEGEKDADALSAEEKAFAKARGISEKAFLKSKKGACE